MDNVKRYNWAENGYMQCVHEGEYVEYSAYADMERQRDEALQRVKELEAEVKKWKEFSLTGDLGKSKTSDPDEERELFETARMYHAIMDENKIVNNHPVNFSDACNITSVAAYTKANALHAERNRRRAAKDGAQ